MIKMLINTEHVFSVVLKANQSHIVPREHKRFDWLPYISAAEKCFHD